MSRRAADVRTLLLHNPTAGAAHPNADELMRQLKAAGLSPKYQSSKDDYKADPAQAMGPGDRRRRRRHGGAGRPRLRNRDIPLAILPIGTANNIARALGLNGDIEDSDIALAHGTAQAPRYRRGAWPVGQASVSRGGGLRHDCQGHCA